MKVSQMRLSTILLCLLLVAPGFCDLQLDTNVVSKNEDHLTIDIKYPAFSGLAASRQASQSVKKWVDATVAEFEGEFAKAKAEGLGGPPWSLDVDYPNIYQTPRLVALFFHGYDYRGGAHGMPVMAPLVIETASGKSVPPEGLFKPGSAYLQRLSKLCYQDLIGRKDTNWDEDWLRRGSAPEAANYQVLYPQADGLLVVFPPYQVDSYAAGPQEVVIPYAKLADILNPKLFSVK
ncbi:MAG: DUF3298 and DUF4163 domain-containing protein [Candidatus Eremiobacteraeota bacterium]|nr:DUF3298 and DUF4163 domain-containing protein [Candidatus Eremiobacteraeota bacterium]